MATHNVALYADVATRVRRQLDDSVANSNPFYPRLTTTVPTNTDRESFDWLGAYSMGVFAWYKAVRILLT